LKALKHLLRGFGITYRPGSQRPEERKTALDILGGGPLPSSSSADQKGEKTMAIQSGEIELKTGIRLHCVGQGDPQGKVVVFLHGYLDSWKSFQLVLDRLDPQYMAYALDQRGHGETSKPEGRYAITDFSGDVIAFMDALGIERASLVGHSMGSFIARQVALSAPACVGNPVLVELEELIPTLNEPLDPQFVYDFQVDSFHGPANKEFMATVVAETLKVPLRVWRDALAGLKACDHQDRLDRISQPTLILGGVHDFIFPQLDQEKVAELIPGSTLKLYDEASHSPNWEMPDLVTAEIESFLK